MELFESAFKILYNTVNRNNDITFVQWHFGTIVNVKLGPVVAKLFALGQSVAYPVSVGRFWLFLNTISHRLFHDWTPFCLLLRLKENLLQFISLLSIYLRSYCIFVQCFFVVVWCPNGRTLNSSNTVADT